MGSFVWYVVDFVNRALLKMIVLSAVQSSTLTLIPNASLLTDTSAMFDAMWDAIFVRYLLVMLRTQLSELAHVSRRMYP